MALGTGAGAWSVQRKREKSFGAANPIARQPLHQANHRPSRRVRRGCGSCSPACTDRSSGGCCRPPHSPGCWRHRCPPWPTTAPTPRSGATARCPPSRSRAPAPARRALRPLRSLLRRRVPPRHHRSHRHRLPRRRVPRPSPPLRRLRLRLPRLPRLPCRLLHPRHHRRPPRPSAPRSARRAPSRSPPTADPGARNPAAGPPWSRSRSSSPRPRCWPRPSFVPAPVSPARRYLCRNGSS